MQLKGDSCEYTEKDTIYDNDSPLTAIAILIPIVMPFKIVIPPASYTLGSHIAIFIAMFLSPLMAVFVILASSFGFLMAGYPMVIVFRAFPIYLLVL